MSKRFFGRWAELQLLCLCRALIRPTPVLVCDEATSSVDGVTDELMHDIILGMPNTTVLSICHRLSRVPGFDLVLILGQGRLLEFGPPTVLLANKASELNRMMSHAAAGGLI